jgi:hypothetical protein
MRPNTLSMLDLSTGHLSLATRELLERSEDCAELGVTWRPDGYFLSADPENFRHRDLPPDLLHCVRYAHANGAAYLLFDTDAAQQDGLPWYEDGNTPDLTGTGIEASQLVMIGDVTYVNPNHVDPESLRVEPTWTEAVGDRDVEAVEGALWVGIGPASVRLLLDEEGDLRITALPRGREMETPVHEVALAADLFEAEPDEGPAP